MTRPALQFLAHELEALRARGRLRRWRDPGDLAPRLLDACSNDYLGYGAPAKPDTASAATGARGSRLVTGDSAEVRELEDEVAAWVGHEAALVFTSGYAANVGTLACLAGPGDLVLSDERNHASIIDGCRLSRATVRVFPHRRADGVARLLSEGGGRRRWVVVESYFSMDGTASPLKELRAACDHAGAGLVVDEAHALGVFGPDGAGLCAREGIAADVLIGTFGKAVGVQGAFAASDAIAIEWLWNRARAFVFSTGMSPLLCGRITEHVRRARDDARGRDRLWRLARTVRSALADAGMPVAPGSEGPIIPVLVGDDRVCVEYEQRLRARGIRVKAIRPPTVPEGSSRLRVTVRASMSDEEVATLTEGLVACRP